MEVERFPVWCWKSWLGLGWNLSIPTIEVDTRWGVPTYDSANETESYLLNGEEMALMTHPAVCMPSVRHPAWTVQAVAEAFERELARRQVPVGRSRQEINVLMQSDRLDVS